MNGYALTAVFLICATLLQLTNDNRQQTYNHCVGWFAEESLRLKCAEAVYGSKKDR